MLIVKKILILIKNKIVAFDLKVICEHFGYSCIFENRRPGDEMSVKSDSFDLIFMDFLIVEAQDILEEAVSICNNIKLPVIFLTTVSQDKIGENRLNNRCLFITMPFIREEIYRAIKHLENNYSYP